MPASNRILDGKATKSSESGQGISPAPTHSQLPHESELSVEVLPAAGPDVEKLPVGQRKPRKSKGIVKELPKDVTNLTSEQRPQDSINSASSAPVVRHLSPLSRPLNQAPANGVTNPVSIIRSTQDVVIHANQSSSPRLPDNSQSCQEGPDIAPVQTNTPIKCSLPNSESKSSTKTIWPQKYKLALANAAKNALTSGSFNAGKNVSAEEIIRLLDQNPSYEELCRNLERRGFVIDRPHFAQLLLSAVPEAESSKPALQEPNGPARPSASTTEVGNGMFDRYFVVLSLALCRL